MNKVFDKAEKKLGFGFMRLPMISGDEVDIEQTKEMVDYFFKKGYTYCDTAFTYLNGNSEKAIGEAVVARYPRESFTIATKTPMFKPITKEEMYERLHTQLARFGTDYIDYYLLHNIGAQRVQYFEESGAWDFIKEIKEKGYVKHIGFSFHDSAEVLDDILTRHPEAEFVQLQINYVDWLSDNVQSKKNYEVCCKHGKPVVVMEPIKGGALVSLPDEAVEVLKAANPNMSLAEWALRYVESLDNVAVVLSGMSTIDQMKENADNMVDQRPLTDAEMAAIDKVREILNKIPTVPCTKCGYCMEVCPVGIQIPSMLSSYNGYQLFGYGGGINDYRNHAIKNGVRPSACVECHSCEGNCPQQIKITDYLKKVTEYYGDLEA